MEFRLFIEKLTAEMDKAALPGEFAQFEMAPDGRPHQPLKLCEAKNGGVLILLYPVNGEPYFVLPRRTDYPGVHGGQVSFPGARMELQDKDLGETACRETEEEIGVNAQAIRLIGGISQLYIPPSQFMVYPFVGYLDERPHFRVDPYEVDSVMEVALKVLFRDDIRQKGPIRLSHGSIHNCPYFSIQGHTVWGATAMILNEFIHVVKTIVD